jgi:hypothetical protein
MGRRAALQRDDPLHQRDRERRRRDDRARPLAQTQPEHQIVPRRLGAAKPRARRWIPFGELVAPGEMVLRAAQRAGPGGAIGEGAGARGKEEEAAARNPARPLVPPRAGKEPAVALDHHPLDLLAARGDQSDARLRSLARPRPRPFGARFGLAVAAAGDDRPDPPGRPGGAGGGLALGMVRPIDVLDFVPDPGRQGVQDPPPLRRIQLAPGRQHGGRPVPVEGREKRDSHVHAPPRSRGQSLSPAGRSSGRRGP